jgi:hypothetical protein
MKAPKRKLPYIDDGGTIVADTSFIIDHLKARYGDPLDAALPPLERAQATAFQRLIEENLCGMLAQMAVPGGCRPRCERLVSIAGVIFSSPPQFRQCSSSISSTLAGTQAGQCSDRQF